MNIPVELQIWTAEDCAQYLRFTRDHFLRHIQHAEGFPKPLQMSDGGRPKWAAKDVIAWALK